MAGWRKYPIGNVTMHMGLPAEGDVPTIEIFYNGIVPIASNSKLGLPK